MSPTSISKQSAAGKCRGNTTKTLIMKHFLFLFAFLCCSTLALAQSGAPRKFNYQAVPRTASGDLLPANSTVKVQFSISEDGPTAVQYVEEHTATVSQHGVVNALVGDGVASGLLPHAFDALDWSKHSYFLAVAVDLNNDGEFSNDEKFPASQLLSVPYALYAEKSGNTGHPTDQADFATITGSGTANFLPKFTGAATVGNSAIFQSAAGNVGINTITPDGNLHIEGGKVVLGNAGQRFNIVLRSNGKVAFEANGNTNDSTLVIDDSGDRSVNIGTNASLPGFKLHVVGKAKFDNGVFFGSAEGFTDGGSSQIAANASIRPTTNNTRTLGTSALRWSEVWARKGFFPDGVIVGTVEGFSDGGANQIAANSTIRPTTNNTRSLGTSALRWSEVWARKGFFPDGVIVGTVEGFSDGGANQIAANSTIRPTTNNTRSLGTSALRWSEVWARKGFFPDGVIVGTVEGFSDGGANQIAANASIRPTTNNTRTLGTSALRWSEVWARKGFFPDGVIVGTVEGFSDGGANQVACNSNIRPTVDNQRSLGSSTFRWKDVWAVDGTINTSDARLKKDVQPISYGLDEVMKLRPVSFLWKQEGFDRERRLGFIAQELVPVLKEVVRTEELVTDPATGKDIWSPTERLGVAYTEIIPVAVKAIQEQQSVIAAQQQEIKDLRSQLAEMRTGLAEVKAMVQGAQASSNK